MAQGGQSFLAFAEHQRSEGVAHRYLSEVLSEF
jgi:hypothetical protein